MRCFHSEKIFQCPHCEKAFCRPDKLRLHMLRHSDRKDFLCSTCGKQFKVMPSEMLKNVKKKKRIFIDFCFIPFFCGAKRKDKLREHMQRMHNPDREAKKAERVHRSKALKLKTPATDFESFVFKCRLCMMGFRRRGMLVSGMARFGYSEGIAARLL